MGQHYVPNVKLSIKADDTHQPVATTHTLFPATMPALFNFLFCHKTPRRPTRPAPPAARAPFSPVQFARFSESTSSELDLAPTSSYFRRQPALFTLFPDGRNLSSDLSEAAYHAPSSSTLGDPIIAPPKTLSSCSSRNTSETDLGSPPPTLPMPRVLQQTPVGGKAYQGHLGSIRAECWLFYVEQHQLHDLHPQDFLIIRSDSFPDPGIRYRLEQFLEIDSDSEGRIMWAQAWDRSRPLAFLIFQPCGVPPSDKTLAHFGLDRTCLPDMEVTGR